MKKILALLMSLIMVCIVPVTAKAAKTKITVSNAKAEQSQMVYLKVKLSDCTKADTLGISFKFNSSVLKKIASDCSWDNKGTLQDFDIAKDNGVWATNKAKNLNGEICTLAFRVKADAPAGDTDVTCVLTVKKDDKVIGTYTAKGVVSVKGDDSQDNKEEGSEQAKPNTPDNTGDSDTTDGLNNSDTLIDSTKDEAVMTKPENTVGNTTNKDKNTAVSNDTIKDNQDTSTGLDEQHKNAGMANDAFTEHQHTDACDHDADKAEEVQKSKISDVIWLVCASLVGAGVVTLIIKKVDRKKK